MIAQKDLDTINGFLRRKYGIDTATGREMWKVVWSESEFEYRYDTFTDWDETGTIFIREVTETRLVKRFNYIKDRYVLCNLQGVPLESQDELAGIKLSYEPIWTFETPRTQKYLPPTSDACEFIINTVYSKLNRGGHTKKYVDPRDGMDTEEMAKVERRRVDEIALELFGEDSGITEKYGDTVILDKRNAEIKGE